MNRTLQRHRRLCADLAQVLIAAFSLAASFWLRFEFRLDPPYPRMLIESLPILIAAKLLVFRAFGLRDLAWRYFGFEDLVRIAGANLAASFAAALVLRSVIGSAFPRSIHVIDLLAATTLLVVAHAAAKAFFDARAEKPHAPLVPAAIFGAGRAGVKLLEEIRSGPRSGFEIRGFLDDDPFKRHLRIQGVPVLGGRKQLAAAARRARIEAVLIALPHAEGDSIAAIVEECRRVQVRVQRVAEPDASPDRRKIRDLRLEDLLCRRPVELDRPRLASRIEGRVALVTGAGGTIGSELCRHIARFRPAALIGFDHAENALYEIDREMRETCPDVVFHAEIGSVRNERRLAEIFRRHRPDTVYHAAAYKHVPLMESQLFEAVENNVFGTLRVVRAAAEHGSEDAVLISSDKAVRPANVMGATKRLAEMVVQSQAGRTRCVAVRFGNVLGSSGSVVPLFQQQIARGGPVRVTHPDMCRFFMTTFEAAQLVLEAAAIGRGGEIFVLEMGQPVRIEDLARKMILLSGVDPEQVRIEFSGVRPGEKLFEELSAYEEDTVSTRHPQIRSFTGPKLSLAGLGSGLEALRSALDGEDAEGVVECLKELAPDYRPSGFLLERSAPLKAGRVYA